MVEVSRSDSSAWDHMDRHRDKLKPSPDERLHPSSTFVACDLHLIGASPWLLIVHFHVDKGRTKALPSFKSVIEVSRDFRWDLTHRIEAQEISRGHPDREAYVVDIFVERHLPYSACGIEGNASVIFISMKGVIASHHYVRFAGIEAR